MPGPMTHWKFRVLAPLLLSLFLIHTAQGTPIGFLLFGDSGTGEPPQYETAAAMKTYCRDNLCQFVTLLGDNFYPAGVQSVEDPQWVDKFTKPYGPLNLVFYAALGNHDYAGDPQSQIDYSRHNLQWRMPSRYYAYRKENVEFFVIDTNRFDADQRRWLKGLLENSDAPWKIVYGHHPVYSSGEHGPTPLLFSDLLPLLRAQADFYLCGHDHDKEVLVPEGRTAFVVAGTASQSRPVLKGGPITRFVSSSLGFGHLLIDGKTATLRLIQKDGKVEYEQKFHK